MNQGGQNSARPKTHTGHMADNIGWAADYHINEAMMTANDEDTVGITDCACSRTVAGLPWYEAYIKKADQMGSHYEVVEEAESYKFGTSRTHDSEFALIATVAISGHAFVLRISIVKCRVPLLISRTALSTLGMVHDVAAYTADFRPSESKTTAWAAATPGIRQLT